MKINRERELCDECNREVNIIRISPQATLKVLRLCNDCIEDLAKVIANMDKDDKILSFIYDKSQQ